MGYKNMGLTCLYIDRSIGIIVVLCIAVSIVNGACPCDKDEWCLPVKNMTRKEVFMFSLHNDEVNWRGFDWSKMTTVVMVGYISPQLMCFAHQRNVRVILIANYKTKDLLDPTKRHLWVKKQLSLVQDNYLDGINLDYEDPIPADQITVKNAYTALVRETYETFKSSLPFSQVTVDVAWSPECIDLRCYDYKALSLYTDFLFVMSYDEQSQIFGDCIAMANSGYNKTLIGLQLYLYKEKIPASRIVLGLPWYGYRYQCTSLSANVCSIKKVPFRGVNCSDAAGSQHDISTIYPLLISSGAKRMWDTNAASPYFNYKDPTSSNIYQYRYDDWDSITIKCQLSIELGLRGVGVWNADSVPYTNTTQVNFLRIMMWNALVI